MTVSGLGVTGCRVVTSSSQVSTSIQKKRKQVKQKKRVRKRKITSRQNNIVKIKNKQSKTNKLLVGMKKSRQADNVQGSTYKEQQGEQLDNVRWIELQQVLSWHYIYIYIYIYIYYVQIERDI